MANISTVSCVVFSAVLALDALCGDQCVASLFYCDVYMNHHDPADAGLSVLYWTGLYFAQFCHCSCIVLWRESVISKELVS